MKALFLKDDSKLSVVGWIVFMIVSIVPTIMLAIALNLPPWIDWPISLLWIVAVAVWARRVLGVRF